MMRRECLPRQLCALLTICSLLYIHLVVCLPTTQYSIITEYYEDVDVDDFQNLDPRVRAILTRQESQSQLHTTVNQIPGEQPQNITDTTGSNGTHTDPGVIINSNTTLPVTDCRNLYTGRDNKCWAELELTDWTKNWIAAHPCYPDESFARCFLRKEGFFGLDCTGLKLAACTAPQASDLASRPEAFYVAYNIYAINQFFLSWYTAVGDAGSMASLNIDEIVGIINVADNTNLIVGDILIGLTGLFALAPVPLAAISNTVSVGTRVSAGLQLVENALFAYPQIGRYLFPKGGPDQKLIAIASLKTQMVELLQQVQGNLNKTLVSVMTNSTEFLAFASQGNFTMSAPSLADQSNYLLYGFNTYIVSAALAGNEVKAVLALDTNPQKLSTNGSTLNYDIGCKGGYNEQGVCGQWWWDPQTNIAYGLDDFRYMNRDMNKILSRLLTNYTTGELLFRNAYACNLGGGYGQPINVTVNAAGVNTACLSQLEIRRWDMNCREVKINTGCEFIDGPPQNTWMGNCASHSSYSTMDGPKYCVPKSYLGPLIRQGTNKVKLQSS